MFKKSVTKPGVYALGCAVTCTSFMIPAYAHAAADIVPHSENSGFQLDEDLEQQLNAIALDERDSGDIRGFAANDADAEFGSDASGGDTSPGTGADPIQAKSVNDQLAEMAAELKSQREQIATQNALIAKQQLALDVLLRSSTADAELAMQRGSGTSQVMFGSAPLLPGLQAASGSVPLPTTPVGEAPPPEPTVESQVQALPEGQGVLTPRGTLAIDSAFDYTSSSTNRLVFRGFELVPGIQIGLIEASDAVRDTLGTAMTLRYGVTNRFEIETRIPALYRWDRIQVAQQRGESIVREIKLKERGIGDIEFAARYQLNRPTGQGPIWVANLRVKSDTGIGPFDVGYDEFGVATGLATGSGFWGVQPGINFLLPSDPAVIFGSVSYLYHIAKDVDRVVGGARIGRVDPGDAISANLGFGFSLNPRFSFSLGYKHSYIFPSSTTINDTVQRSDSAQVGAFTFGMSYRLTEKQSVNIGFDIGATADAPDLGVSVRFPLSFNLGGRRR
jgi:hypothetical protein